MFVAFRCPGCQSAGTGEVQTGGDVLRCESCGWTRATSEDDMDAGRPARCLTCGCEDLWRQKDFPPQLGLALVGVGALLSTIAWAMYEPIAAIGILMVFALADLVLYALMSDVLVCYRCESRYRRANLAGDDSPRFSLEVAERYRQEALRLEQAAARQR